ncbi:MAG: hypothetical protein H7A26_01840 [Spirochaetales bacterium]|nr:hypothetical protein [Spirochaetales bacterium]
MPFFTGKRILRTALLAVIFCCAVFTVSADFNTTLDSILTEDQISFGSASFILLTGSGALSEDATIEEAAAKMAEMVPKADASADKPVTMGMFSYMAMKTYGISGGIMYRFFPGPRYAIRELRYKKIVQGNAYSTMTLSSERALRIMGRVLDREEKKNAEK